IRYLANAKPAWLRPGMFVRVEAKFNAAGTPTAPIDKLFVVEPYKETQSSRKSKVVPGIHALDRKHSGAQPSRFGVGQIANGVAVLRIGCGNRFAIVRLEGDTATIDIDQFAFEGRGDFRSALRDGDAMLWQGQHEGVKKQDARPTADAFHPEVASLAGGGWGETVVHARVGSMHCHGSPRHSRCVETVPSWSDVT
ncbi:MAG: hypothetical protein AAFP69_15545, partial [Planctomycetota bacterium]